MTDRRSSVGSVHVAPAPAVAPFSPRQAAQHQQAWADSLGVAVASRIRLPEGAQLKLVLIPPGEFPSRSSKDEPTRFIECASIKGDGSETTRRTHGKSAAVFSDPHPCLERY